MVFRCQTCKSRHVKCDALQPACNRCKNAGRTCTWDPNDHAGETGLHFKIENSFAGGKPRRPRKPKNPVIEPANIPPAPSSGIVPQAAYPLDVQAFHYWLENWMFRLEDLPEIGHMYSEHVLFHWARARPGSGIHLALFSFSHAVFGRANHVERAMEEAERAHAQSIVAMQKEMKDLEQLSDDKIDQLLITTMLMSSYQNTMYTIQIPHRVSKVDEVGSRLWKSLCHHEGALALLKLRQQHGPPPYLPLHRVVRRQVMRTCILRGMSIPDFLQNGADYGEEGPALELDALMVRVAALRTKSLALLYSRMGENSSDIVESEGLAAEAYNLDTALTSWPVSLPEKWMFSIPPPSYISEEQGCTYNGIVHAYATHAHATIWGRYRAIRFIVLSIRIRYLTFQLQALNYPSQRSFIAIQQQEIRTAMEVITTELCGCVPFFFNHLDQTGMRSILMGKYTITTNEKILPKMAALLAWPLTVAISCEYIPEPQREWLKGKLSIVAKSLGDAVLASVVEQGEFRF